MKQTVHVAFLVILLLTLASGDDFFAFDGDDFDADAEDLEDEVEFPGGIQDSTSTATLNVPRDPFAIKVFDEAKRIWRDPAHREEYTDEEKKQIHLSWQRAVVLDLDEAVRDVPGDHTARRIAAGHIHDFFSKFVNPTDEPLTGEEEDLLELRVAQMRKREGLLDDSKMLHFGFLTRGSPLQALQGVLKELRALRATRGDRELAEEIARNRERPLLVRQQAEREAAEERARLEQEAAAQALSEKIEKENRASLRERIAAKAADRMRAAESAERARQARLQQQQEAAAAGPAEGTVPAFSFADSPEEAQATAQLLGTQAGAAAEAAEAAQKKQAAARAAEARAAASRAAVLEQEEREKLAAREAWEAKQQKELLEMKSRIAAEEAAAAMKANAENNAAPVEPDTLAGLGESWDSDWEHA